MPGQPSRKIGVGASRRVGNAVLRNRYRRKLKEYYRLNKDLFPEDWHFYVLIRTSISDWSDFEQRFQKIITGP